VPLPAGRRVAVGRAGRRVGFDRAMMGRVGPPAAETALGR